MEMLAIVIGLIAAVVFYSSTMTGYKKAGAGQTYQISANTDVKLTGRSDVRSGARSRVDRGFYSGSVSSSGRSEAYHMPNSIKQTIQQAQTGGSAVRPQAQNRPPVRPPRPGKPPAGQHGMGGPRGSGRR